MTETERDPSIEESVEQILNELEEIHKELHSISRELRVIEENNHTFRDRSIQALLTTAREDMDYLVGEQYQWHREIEELLVEVAEVRGTSAIRDDLAPQDREVEDDD